MVSKEERKEKFDSEHSKDFYKRTARSRPKVTKEIIDKIIELFPTHKNHQIASKLKFSEGMVNMIISVMRKNGITLEKKYQSVTSEVENIIKNNKYK